MGNVTIQGDLTGASLGGYIGGALNLTTAGAIPYVSAAGILNQDPTAFFWDATNNRLGIGTNSPQYPIHVFGSGFQRIAIQSTDNQSQLFLAGGVFTQLYSTGGPLYITNGSANQPIIFRPNAETEAARFSSSTSNLLVGTATDGNFKLDVGASGSSGTSRFYDQTATTGVTKVVVRAGAGQSTTNLQEWQNSSGTVLFSVAPGGETSVGAAQFGAFNVTTPQTKIQMGYGFGGASYFDAEQFVFRTFAAAEKFRLDVVSGLFSFGGQSASFPALKRSSAILQARLADDSANTQLQASRFISDQTTPSASTDAGTAGAIWADATYIYVQTAAGTIKRVALSTF
jgi:hypothetical protein